MQVTIYHNPRCSKSRQALELLKKRGFEPEIVEYLKTPPIGRPSSGFLSFCTSSHASSCVRTSPNINKPVSMIPH